MGGARRRSGQGGDGGRASPGCSSTRLNVELTYPEDLPHLLTLIAAIREEAKPRYLLANRGFGLLPRLTEFVDGILFESFSARWTDEGYAAWPPDVLEYHAQIAEQLLQYDVDLYALDYADTDGPDRVRAPPGRASSACPASSATARCPGSSRSAAAVGPGCVCASLLS